MRAIEITAVVRDDGKVEVQLPPDIAPGLHQIVVVVDGPLRPHGWTMEDRPVHDAALVDPNFTMSRKDLYGDDGR